MKRTPGRSPAGRLLRAGLALGLAWTMGCRAQRGTVLGKAPEGTLRTILAVRAGDTPPLVTLGGVMVEKCPTAGCWFYLRDDTGLIKVDTKSAGFVVVNVPVASKVTISGKIADDGEQTVIEATGIRY